PAPAGPSSAAMLTTGIVRRSHGVRGFFRVQSTSGETAHFMALEEICLRGPAGKEETFSVEECRAAGKDILMKLRGIDSPEDAARYAAWEIRVPREKASPLGKGQYYVNDLCGASIVCGGRGAGTVRSVIEAGACAMLEVINVENRTIFIPFVEAHVGTVDIAARTIELKSEWLLE
ncbi:MAG: ribosome maturation factor RimM, partial [Spirochaetaceae bacterium]|nr:ribosome maturation factor RimM [Spirochaetaceae bacterium]